MRLPGDHWIGQLSREQLDALRLSTVWVTDEREVHAGVPLVRSGVRCMGQTARRIGPA